MLTPTLVLEDERPRLVLGSAGSVRLAGAIAQVVWRVVATVAPAWRRRSTRRACTWRASRCISRAAGTGDRGGSRTEWDIVRWAGSNLFFGGVQAVERRSDGALAAAGDPRRGGAGVVVA